MHHPASAALILLLTIYHAQHVSAGYWEDDLNYIAKVFPEDVARYCPNLPYYGGFVALAGDAAKFCMVDVMSEPEIVEMEYSDSAPTTEPYYGPIDENIKHPVILLWTPRMRNKQGYYKRCPRSTCLVTENRSWLNHSMTKAIHFYGTLFKLTDLPLPRGDNQLWVLLHEESPKNSPVFSYGKMLGLFNMSSTIRQQSHYPLSTQYLRNVKQLTGTTYMKSFQEKTRFQKEESLASIIYVQSDCDVPSDRDRVVRWMMDHVPVDSYGKCVHNKDLPKHLVDPVSGMDHEDFIQLVSKYKFAVAMENGICNDYMTEKLWRPLAVGTIPIVLGAPNIKEWMPSNKSGIHLEDFASIKEMVDFILYLNSNETAYEEFRSFKQTSHKINAKLMETLDRRPWDTDFDAMGMNKDSRKGNYIDGFDCLVCDVLHDRDKPEKAWRIPDINLLVNKTHYGCPLPEKFMDPKDLSKKAPFSDFWYSAWMSSYCDMESMIHHSKGGREPFSKEDYRKMSSYCLKHKHYINAGYE